MKGGDRLTVEVKAEVCGEPVRGVWCPRCSLPSAVAAFVLILVHGNVHGCQLIQACDDCGAEEWL